MSKLEYQALVMGNDDWRRVTCLGNPKYGGWGNTIQRAIAAKWWPPKPKEVWLILDGKPMWKVWEASDA